MPRAEPCDGIAVGGTTAAAPRDPQGRRVNRDFAKFWIGQTISNLGSSFTQWAVPLLVFQLTHSALNLGVAMAATFLPYLFFGLPLGAWMDRVDRKRAMVLLDSINVLVILSIPLVAQFGHLNVWLIYAVTFIQSTVFIAFSAGEFAAIPSLVSTDDLVTANGRIQATFSAAQVAGPLLAGLLVSFLPLVWVMAFDAGSFAISAVSLALIRSSFNVVTEEPKEATTILHDVREGLRYVLSHPVLRNISAMMALINFVNASAFAELVLFATERLDASRFEIGVLFAAGSAGVVVTGLLAGRLRKRFSFTALAMTSLMLMGACLVIFAGVTSYWLALPLWGAASGLGILFNINTGSLRQAIVPNQLLSRVMSIASVLAWSAIPAGALVGGWVVSATDNVAAVYGVIGILIICIAAFFRFFTALGDAQRYVDERRAQEERAANEEVEVLPA
ncbi:MAG: MFS transporter [Actinobacteria bacterium]|nr:MAG: MFS transporter [Actinomycetota bacterium]